MEEKTRSTHEEWQAKNALLVQEVLAKNNRLKQLEDEGRHAIMTSLNNEIFSSKMQAWLDQEQTLYHSWLAEHGYEQSMDYFYNQQISHAEQIQGYVENYDRPLKNKPGDFMLFGKNNMPVAYLYSTQVDLSAYVGKEVILTVAKRAKS